jgi:ubiquinone/menaquinone biosynthesis C-methylase UbiE
MIILTRRHMTTFSESKFAAWLQEIVSKRRDESGLYLEIAQNLPLINARRLLDIGTGTGLQLRVIHGIKSDIELYGLDLSNAAIQRAVQVLGDLDVDLRAGSIVSTTFEDDFFDIVTCNASMSYWNKPGDCLNEIYRILKPGGDVLLFEPHRDIDLDQALDQIRENMADKSPLRRWGAIQLNKFALKRGSSLGMTLYSIPEFQEIVRTSDFCENQEITETSLLGIPIFARIHLWKGDKDGP